MLRGDFSTMPLADVLQWLDASRRGNVVRVEHDEFPTWFMTDDRAVVRAPRPEARGPLADEATGDEGFSALATEVLFDLFLWPTGEFELFEPVVPKDPHVELSLPLQYLTLEGLRYLDEWPRLDALYADETARLEIRKEPEQPVGLIQRAIVRAARKKPSLAEVRLQLGLSRSAMLRRVEELRSLGIVGVSGASESVDLIAQLISQASVLLREQQFDEAGHVFRTLLASNPQDERARRLLRETERQHVDSLYRKLKPKHTVRRLQTELLSSDRRLSATDQVVLDLLGEPQKVSLAVLSSPLRELETLKSLLALLRLGMVRLERH